MASGSRRRAQRRRQVDPCSTPRRRTRRRGRRPVRRPSERFRPGASPPRRPRACRRPRSPRDHGRRVRPARTNAHIRPCSARRARPTSAVVRTTLDRLDLLRVGGRIVATLSGGEFQRVADRPGAGAGGPVLLLDEPTTALDLGHQQQVLELVHELRRTKGMTVCRRCTTSPSPGGSRIASPALAGPDRGDGSRSVVLNTAVISEHFGTSVRVLGAGRPAWPSCPCRGHRDAAAPRCRRRPADRPSRQAAVARARPHRERQGEASAAMGVVMRAVARDWRVASSSFVKNERWRTGEEASARTLGVEWWTGGDGFTWESTDLDRTEQVARAAWDAARDDRRRRAPAGGARRGHVPDQLGLDPAGRRRRRDPEPSVPRERRRDGPRRRRRCATSRTPSRRWRA